MFLYTVSFVLAGNIRLQRGLEDRWRIVVHRWGCCRPGGMQNAFAFGGVQDMVLEMVVVSFEAQLKDWTRCPY
jgi:hypothetical protein